MRFQIDHDYHIHTNLSSCSKSPEQTPQRILEYAREQGLSRIILTDHYWDRAVPGASGWYQPQDFDHISKALPLPREEGVEFLFGCETDMDRFLTLGIPASRFDDFSFIIIPTTHMHMKGFTLAEEDFTNNPRVAQLWTQRLEALLSMDLPFHKVGIPHLCCSLMNKKSRADFLDTLDRIPDEEMARVFTKAASCGCGIEINSCDMSFADQESDTVLRPFRIAKNCGCKFYLGSDAHSPGDFDKTRNVFQRAITLLDLTEDDKFQLAGK